MEFYPSMRYHRDGHAMLVADEQAAAALGPEWADSPAVWEAQRDDPILVPFVQTDPAPHVTGNTVTVTDTEATAWISVAPDPALLVKVRKGWPKGKPRKPKPEVSTNGHRTDDHS